jgi:ribulose kinase
MSYYIGVDVGTGSARAALVSENGEILSESTYATTTYRDDRDHNIFEQSTTESASLLRRGVLANKCRPQI